MLEGGESNYVRGLERGESNHVKVLELRLNGGVDGVEIKWGDVIGLKLRLKQLSCLKGKIYILDSPLKHY